MPSSLSKAAGAPQGRARSGIALVWEASVREFKSHCPDCDLGSDHRQTTVNGVRCSGCILVLDTSGGGFDSHVPDWQRSQKIQDRLGQATYAAFMASCWNWYTGTA